MLSQAIVEFGKPLQAIESPTPEPKGTEVLLKVENAGVCHSDVHIHDGYFDLGGGNKLPMANIKLPHTLGHEIEGEVIAVGPDAKGVKVGERYAAFPWIGCGDCPACQRGEENLCLRPRQLGCSANVPGGYATHVIVPASEISDRFRQHRTGAGRRLYVLGPDRLRRDEEGRQAWCRTTRWWCWAAAASA